jgi:hypothetical protein
VYFVQFRFECLWSSTVTRKLSVSLCVFRCAASPVITGGDGTYMYTVSFNSGTPVALTTIHQHTATGGSYVFTVTDGRDCQQLVTRLR